MEKIICKHCGSEQTSKNGLRKGKQLYKCRGCGKNFFKPLEDKESRKQLAVVLYGTGKASYRYLAKLFGVCPATILKWVKKYAQQIEMPEISKDLTEIEIDELWHFLHSKKTSYGLSGLSIDEVEKLWHGLREVEIQKLSNGSTKK
jgi:transposase-like protein